MIMCSNGVEEKLRKIPFLCNGTDTAEPSLVDRYVKFEPRYCYQFWRFFKKYFFKFFQKLSLVWYRILAQLVVGTLTVTGWLVSRPFTVFALA